jgi:hypothetical protein
MKKQKKIQIHTYCLPYYIDKKHKKKYILIGFKKKYNSIDGYIHSNSGQVVLIGGHLHKKFTIRKYAN